MKINVKCAYDELMALEAVVPNPRNPNKHNDAQVELLAKIIKFQGWRNPIVISTRSGFIVKGHGRYLAAKLLGLKEVPVDKQDYETEAMEYADLIADNRIAELAEWDNPMLKDLLQEIDTGEMDMELTGFDEASLEDLLVYTGNFERGGQEFTNIVDQFAAEGQGSTKNQNWFYVEYYEDDELYTEIKTALDGEMRSNHEMKPEIFTKMINLLKAERGTNAVSDD